MSDHDRDELEELISSAAPSVRAPVRENALRAMAEVNPRRPSVRGRLQTAALTALVLLALGTVPYSANNARSSAMMAMASQEAAVVLSASEERAPRPASAPEASPEDLQSKLLAPYRSRAAAFVRERYPEDPEMFLAAGLLTENDDEALALLRAAVDTSGSPAAWSAYVRRLERAGPMYDRPGRWGVDPEDTKNLAEMERHMAELHLPAKLTPEETASVLAAIARWEQADPQNAMPVALEVYYLYGLHDDAKALERWQHAASLPLVSARNPESMRAVARLLCRMGMSEMQGIELSHMVVDLDPYRFLRECARIAVYEGRMAQMQGRAADAIAWWDSTIAIGRHAQESPSDLIDYLVGAAVESIGAAPTWKWYSGHTVGMEDGPLSKGRYFWGSQHEFYVSQVGEAADREVRDSLVRAKARMMAHRRLLAGFSFVSPAIGWTRPLSGAMTCAIALVMLLALFLAVGVWRRRQADEAAALPTKWRAFIVLLTLLPAFAGAAAAAAWVVGLVSREEGLRLLYLGGPVASLLLALGLSLVAAVRSRRPGARLVTAWRGNLRATLLVSVAACAVVVLGLAGAVKVAQRRSVAEWYRGSPTAMERLERALGPAWTDPKIPPDSWRAEYPPEPKR